jgi:hypothetical protein
LENKNFPFCINNHVSIASEMMQTRLGIDGAHYELLKELCYEEQTKCKAEVNHHVGRDLDTGSWKQCQDFLYKELGLKVKINRKTGKPTTDENALRELRVEYPQHKELLNAFIRERHISKKIESYIEIQFDEDGMLGYGANPAGTETNRWAFNKSPRDRGCNPQTLPKVMRLMCKAPEGCVFIAPDLPQADARIVAWDAQCERLIQLFSDPGVHFHLENCIRMGAVAGSPFAGITREVAYAPGWKDNDPRYTTGKAMGHAANYRMAAKRLAMELGISISDARQLLDIYLHQMYPEIERWHFNIKERIRKTGFLETPFPFQRRRVFYGAWGELMLRGKIANTTWNEACAYIPQSVVADIVNTGMERLWHEEPNVRFHKHDHDSYLASIPGDLIGDICPRAVEFLKVRLVIHDRPLEMIPEMQIGRNYGAMVEWKGEQTLEQLVPRLEAMERKKLDEADIRNQLYGYY